MVMVPLVASADRVSSPYEPGRVTIHLGFYQQNRDLRGIRLGAGYNVIEGLELGATFSHISGMPADAEIFSPFATYTFTGSTYDQLGLAPYVGLAFQHRWTAPNYYIADTIGARVGLALTIKNPGRVSFTFGGGVVWDHPIHQCAFDDCTRYPESPDEIGPEIFARVAF